MVRSISLIATALFALLILSPACAGDTDPLSLPGVINEALGDPATSKVFGKEIVSFEPMWLMRQIMSHDATRIAISECNAKDVLTCDEAKVWLHQLDAQCTTVLLGVIDLSKHPGIEPKDVFNAEHPELMLFATPANDKVPRLVNLYGVTDANMFAAAMCPAESNAFGAAIRGLRMMPSIGRQPR